MNIKKHFTIALFYSVLTLGMFFAMQYIFAWTNPASSPPSGNVSPPINEGTTAQVKDGSLGISGNLTAPIFYDSDNTGYYINPAETSRFSIINLGGASRSGWPVDTDTKCNSSGSCSQVCVGSDCRSSWPNDAWPDGNYCIMANGSCPAGFYQRSLGLYVGAHAHDQCAVGNRVAGSSNCSGSYPMATLTIVACCK